MWFFFFFFAFFLLHLLHLCDKVSYVCLSFDEWDLKVFCLKVKQQSGLKASSLKYHFGILLFSLNLSLNELRKELDICVNGFLLAFSDPFTVKIPHFRGVKKKALCDMLMKYACSRGITCLESIHVLQKAWACWALHPVNERGNGQKGNRLV